MITIEISGPAKSGKTTVENVIKKALEECGAVVQVDTGGDRNWRRDSILLANRNQILHETRVSIVVKTLRK